MGSADSLVVRLERTKWLQCEKCPKIFINNNHLARHNEWHEFEEHLAQPGVMEHMESAQVVLDRVTIYRCTKCSRGFLNYFHLNDHQIQHSKDEKSNRNGPEESNNNILKPHKCQECGARFVAQSTLTTHLKVHEPYPNVCSLCGVGFYQKKDLDYHGRLVHPTAKTWKPKIRYNGPKAKSEFAKQLSVPSESESDSEDKSYAPKKTSGAKPRLKAQLVFKPKAEVKTENKTKINDKENLYLNGDGKYECTYCGEVCKTKQLYKFHLNSHTGALPYVCDRCPTAYSTKAFLMVHKQMHGLSRHAEFKCEVCHKIMKSKCYLQTHMLIHTGEKQFSCDICARAFTQPGALKVHMKIHSDVYEYECVYCKKQFKVLSAMKLHERTHTGERPYVCPYCDKRFGDPSAFKRHKRIHTGEKPYKCDVCEKAFSDYSAYTVHVKRHAGVRFPCPHCSKETTSHASLFTHIKAVHENNPKFECDYCARRFVLKRNLIPHIRTVHQQHKPYRCDICHKMCTSKQNRATHVKFVHMIKSNDYVCEHCFVTFKTNTNLVTHMQRVHMGHELKYQCDHCKAKFMFKDVVFKHIQYHHNRFTCPKCKTIVSTSAQLRHHKCIKCKCCDKYFRNKLSLRKHLKPRRKIRKHHCRECLKWFTDREALISHARKRHIKYCDRCGKSFYKKRVLKVHIWTQHMVTLYCNVCIKPFYRESDLWRHKRTQHLNISVKKSASEDEGETSVET